MTHELKKILTAFTIAKEQGKKAVLATVVALDGSSYRRPGVRMLILDSGETIGAVSGGCVEKEVIRQADSVFKTNIAKVMTYDGRYRLGCEGILYILIETFNPSTDFVTTFWSTIKNRTNFSVSSYYEKKDAKNLSYGSIFTFLDEKIAVSNSFTKNDELPIFNQNLEPCFRLLVVGAEHDAVQLTSYAALTGWEVTVCTIPNEEKQLSDFPGAEILQVTTPENLDVSAIDKQTAVVLMTHSYVKDLQYLLTLKNTNPVYLGLLGPATRREKLLNEFIEHYPEVTEEFLDVIHGPAGLNIGAETPQEISIAIVAEILTVIRKREPIQLKDKIGKIHN
ncbi:XdhC family protein [Cellulophaga fucicola]|uniref:Xanthine and CO dehydrogenase maturation factor, XdhC/CoxF family n=1 Tax=Cellulophaga fucicola TaxID=76595 RepID=A0A1K1M8R5_9FLAO|nr:XdhC/CoxI family protein [Cellulophaga fucicola]SFW19495.1 Xanthine and CO dehydrogenase maturation factor, XdhC/CoxF family [Cellulophaga fucicola]